MSIIGHISKPAGDLIDVVIRTIISMSERNSYVLVVQNKTKFSMRRVESYNNADNWPFGDIAPETSDAVSLNRKSFSFAAKYEIREMGLHVILAASSPVVGGDKIGLQSPAESVPCKDVWDRMDDGNDKSGRHARAHVMSTTEVAAKTWVWHIEP
ncbi:MAG: hypothetical protein IPF99_37325 [Deltaproteobacteria bacterium]|mgnify:CR=1 FL=1|nr:hypothetical protein [Deltaproteobacteria bacterium]MBP6829444.1 hypothetical protein [Deltaproteobacteria bacterium]